MRCITIWQPWASLIAYGYKRFETRSWATKYRGPIAIHAGKTFNKRVFWDLVDHYYSDDRMNEDLPTGAIIAVAELVDCWKVVEEHLLEAQLPGEKRVKFLDVKEIPFGDFTPGRYAWELANVQRIEPIPMKGQQGLWNWGGERDGSNSEV